MRYNFAPVSDEDEAWVGPIRTRPKISVVEEISSTGWKSDLPHMPYHAVELCPLLDSRVFGRRIREFATDVAML